MNTTTTGYAAPLQTSRQHDTQSAQVAHTPGGTITLAMTEAAADVLSRLLFHYDHLSVKVADEGRETVDKYDPSFWAQVATAIATQRVVALHGPTPAEIAAHTAMVPLVRLVTDHTTHPVEQLGDDTLAMIADEVAEVHSL